jgi:hypothetical protein
MMQPGISSELVSFGIYYGNGEIRMSDNEIDLREF